MKHRSIVTFALLITVGLLLAPPAGAGVGFGVSIGGSDWGLSFGFSSYDYPVYGPGWAASSWSLDFDTALDGYGSWIEVDGLGRVWHPWVAADWRPYTYGRWVFTSFGWTWVAYEPWGYIPHHYGSWAMTSYGWVWAPGYTYYPAHVTWLSAGASIGWYATPPYGWSDTYRAYRHGYRRGFDHGYDRGYRNGWQDARYANFIETRRFTSEDVARYVRPGDRYVSTARGGIRVLRSGPERRRIERVSGRSIPRVRIDERSVSISGRTVRAVRPLGVTRSISRYSATTVRTALAPSVVERLQTRHRGTRGVTTVSSRRSWTSRTTTASGPSTAISRARSERRATRSRSISREVQGTSRRWRTTPGSTRTTAVRSGWAHSEEVRPFERPVAHTSSTVTRSRRLSIQRPAGSWTHGAGTVHRLDQRFGAPSRGTFRQQRVVTRSTRRSSSRSSRSFTPYRGGSGIVSHRRSFSSRTYGAHASTSRPVIRSRSARSERITASHSRSISHSRRTFSTSRRSVHVSRRSPRRPR